MTRAANHPVAITLRMAAAIAAVAAVGAITISLAACMSTQRTQPLDEALRTYNDGVRWQRFTVAAAHVPPARRDDFLDRRDQLSEDLRISDYEVIRIRHDSSGRLARVHIKFTWHLDSRGVVHTTHTVQSWQRQGKGWILAGERHLRGEPMPGLPVARKDSASDDDGDEDSNGDEDSGGGDTERDPNGDGDADRGGDSGEDAADHGGALRLDTR